LPKQMSILRTFQNLFFGRLKKVGETLGKCIKLKRDYVEK